MSSNMTPELLLERLNSRFPDTIIASETPYGLLTVEIAPEKIIEFVSGLKTDEHLQVGYLTNIAGVHYPDDQGREFAVVYHLHSLIYNFRIRIKCFLSQDNTSISSLTSIYAGANWMERETFDFYGIQFEGHPNLVRILNEDSMDYFPMRKEYHMEDATREDKDDRFFGR